MMNIKHNMNIRTRKGVSFDLVTNKTSHADLPDKNGCGYVIN